MNTLLGVTTLFKIGLNSLLKGIYFKKKRFAPNLVLLEKTLGTRFAGKKKQQKKKTETKNNVTKTVVHVKMTEKLQCIQSPYCLACWVRFSADGISNIFP